MRIAITGSSGLVGTAVAAALQGEGHDVVRLVRGDTRAAGTARWDPATGQLDLDAVGAIDAVVHLAGENVAGGRWTKARRRRRARVRRRKTARKDRGRIRSSPSRLRPYHHG